MSNSNPTTDEYPLCHLVHLVQLDDPRHQYRYSAPHALHCLLAAFPVLMGRQSSGTGKWYRFDLDMAFWGVYEASGHFFGRHPAAFFLLDRAACLVRRAVAMVTERESDPRHAVPGMNDSIPASELLSPGKRLLFRTWLHGAILMMLPPLFGLCILGRLDIRRPARED